MFFTACTKDLEYDFEDTEPKVVVISCVEPDSPIKLRITYSRFFLSTAPFRTVDNAEVGLCVNGAESGAAVSFSDGYYTIDYRPQPGDRLDLTVQVPSYGTLSASTVVPSMVNVSDLRTVKRIDEDGDTWHTLRFTLHDPADEDNYYFIRIVRYEEYEGQRFNYYYDYFSCNDPLLSSTPDIGNILDNIDGGNASEWEGNLLYFPDDNIAGRDHEVELTLEAYSYQSDWNYQLEVTSFSRDRYLYEVTTDLYSDDAVEALFSEPVQIHHNVSGGIGIFAARSRSYFDIPFQP